MLDAAGALPRSLHIDAVARRVRLDPRDPAFVQDPSVAYAAIHATCPFFFWEDYGHWCAASHAAVSALFRDRRFGRDLKHVASRAELGWAEPAEHIRVFDAFEDRSMLENEPPVHTRLRTLVNRAFVSRAVERLRPRVASLAHALIDRFPMDEPFDLLPAFAEPIPVTVIAEMLGVPAADAPQLLAWSHRMVAMYQFGRTRAVEDAAEAATKDFSAYVRAVVARRRGQPGDDILSLLLAAEEGGDRLSEEELVTNSILLLNAGHEATVHGIGNAVAMLSRRGLDPVAAFAAPETTAASVEELMRLAPPLHLFTRHAIEAVEVEDVPFRRGDTLGLLIGAANRDPSAYGDPARYRPGRDGPAHLAFGAGIHFCIGAPLARLELQVALPILFARCPRLRLAAAPRFADRYHFHGLQALAVTRA